MLGCECQPIPSKVSCRWTELIRSVPIRRINNGDVTMFRWVSADEEVKQQEGLA